MVFRFMAMCALTFGFLPFLAAYSFTAFDESATFGITFQTWALGMVPIVVGWLLFFLPGLVPGMGPRYIGWALEKLGFVGFVSELKAYGLKTLRKASSFDIKTLKPSIPTLSKPKMDSSDEIEPSFLANSRAETKKLSEKFSNSLSKIPEPDIEKITTGVKKIGESLKTTLTPEGLDHAVILNAHTLELFGLLKYALQAVIPYLHLSATDLEFSHAVVNALPERPAPGDEALGTSVVYLHYPEDEREDLLNQATGYSVYLDEKTFETASDGDLHAGLTILNAIFQIAVHRGGVADPLLTIGAR